MTGPEEQFGFDALLQDAETDNQNRAFAKATAHLPDTWEEAEAFYAGLVRDHHKAMMNGDEVATMALRVQAGLLARKFDPERRGILAHDDAPGYALARSFASQPGEVPLWGQTGRFCVEVSGVSVSIELDGMFGIGSGTHFWPGFAARAVDPAKPFISETGYRSFLGIYSPPAAGIAPEAHVCRVIEACIAQDLRGRLTGIALRFQEKKSKK